MGYPRAVIVDPNQPSFYHCMSRCVRRAFLCGIDEASGQNFDHRRDWIEKRLLVLADSFAVGLYAWAVMSNHTHVVLHVDPRLPERWTDEEVARRWARLDRMLAEVPESHIEQRIRRTLDQPERVVELRRRLGSLSWFMRFLNECIAREANAEDRCTGRFWEGRFKSQALLDDAAVIACMAYVDLNPIRAGIADELVDSDFTTIQRRLRSLGSDPRAGDAPLQAMAGINGPAVQGITVNAYIDLADCTGRLARSDKRGAISANAARALEVIRGSPHWWTGCVHRIEEVFGSTVGMPRTLKSHALETGRSCLRGVGLVCEA
jgi:REP element-mobilizing transposase RayT